MILNEMVRLRRTDPHCGYEQTCSCATWIPGEGDIELAWRARKREREARRARLGRSRRGLPK